MKKIVMVFLGIMSCAGAMAAEYDFRCLKSITSNNPIRLQFDFPDNDEKSGFVTYQKGSGRIEVKKVKSKENRTESARPSEFETEWVEKNANGEAGKYLVVSQGARIYDFKYIRKKDGKVFKFEEDLDASADKNCQWLSQKS